MPVLQQLHWLPAYRQMAFKMGTLMFQMLHGLVSSNLSDSGQLMPTGHRQLRSATTPTCRTVNQDPAQDRSFNVAGPRLWNKLPSELRLIGNFTGSFRARLKAHLFLFD